MIIPSYVFLIVFSTSVFIAVCLTNLVTTAMHTSGLTNAQLRRITRQVLVFAAAWLALGLAISYSDIIVPKPEQSIPYLAILILGPTILANYLLFKSALATTVLRAIPLHALATVQVYRIIGIIFLLLYSDGILSGYFAFSTAWGDIMIGITAPVVGFLLWRNVGKFRWFGIAWCVAGILDLFFVLYKAVNSAPGPQQTTAFDVPTVIVGYFPFSIIPLFVVPISLILHVQMLRLLLGPRHPDHR